MVQVRRKENDNSDSYLFVDICIYIYLSTVSFIMYLSYMTGTKKYTLRNIMIYNITYK